MPTGCSARTRTCSGNWGSNSRGAVPGRSANNMNTTVTVEHKPVRVRLSAAAQRALAARSQPLLVEMELYFSCLIRKRVRFRDLDAAAGTTPVNEHLHLRFHPVMTATCGVDHQGDEPPLTDFPISNVGAFVPRWLHIDCRDGDWTGQFGFD